MTAQVWLPFATKVDYSKSKGYGPFAPGNFHGVVLHVNVDENGTSDAFFANNPADVCPNFQVYKDGSVHQYLPLDWQPWCQVEGNSTWAAIETAGMPDEPLTSAQEIAIARILAAYRDNMGMVMQVTDSPMVKGFGTHSMGGTAWGGHACPGTIRAGQRADILKMVPGAVQLHDMTPGPDKLLINQTLHANEQINSLNNGTSLVMQGDGNLVQYALGKVIWSSGTSGNAGAYATFQGDGNFVVYSRMGQPLWDAQSASRNPSFTGIHWQPGGVFLVIQPDTNVCIYPPSGSAVWSLR